MKDEHIFLSDEMSTSNDLEDIYFVEHIPVVIFEVKLQISEEVTTLCAENVPPTHLPNHVHTIQFFVFFVTF